ILYKDNVTPLPGIGVDVKIKAGVGPVISNPIQSVADVEKLGEFNANEHTPLVLETIKTLAEEQLNVPLIGFAGEPFTFASYMIEGGSSRNYN
ncbi:uroporphyrinogen decarboxylase family protein, partial [Lysinibacillus fusiformis]|uniref:uroporphyrinogen decarboxylase family protein n=1 Tax=Lysinibacillus fusiformis TaxID=28031 RepID=UPI0023ED1DA2